MDKNLTKYRIFSLLIFSIGIILLVYMVSIENELGALPILLIIIGIVWFVMNQSKINKLKK